MSIQIDPGKRLPRPRRSKRSLWKFLAIMAIIGLVVSIPVSYRISHSAQTRLSRAQEISKQLDKIVSLRSQARHEDDKITSLIRSFRHPGMPKALTKAFESANLPSVFVCRTYTDWSNAKSFYLYASDETQELVLDLKLWPGGPILRGGKTAYPDGLIREKLLQPLQPGKLHILSYGIIRETNDTTFRVTLDDRELFSKTFHEHFNGSSSSSFNSNQLFGILRQNTLENRFINYRMVIQSGRWLELSDNTYQFANRQKSEPRKQTISISAALRSGAPLYIPHHLHQTVKDQLDLEWNAQSMRYKIAGLKDAANETK